MISGLTSNGNYPTQSGAAPARERSDVARNPAARPESVTADVQESLARHGSARDAADQTINGELLQRRVDARRAADDARLERFRADELPLSTTEALATFAEVAAHRDEQDVDLAGINLSI